MIFQECFYLGTFFVMIPVMVKTIILKLDRESERLNQMIKKRRNALRKLTKRYDILEGEIQCVQEEYDQRIGSLFRRSNILEQQILRMRHIRSYIDEGYSYEEALLRYEEKEGKKSHQEKQWEFYVDIKEPVKTSKKEEIAIRTLWRKLVQKNHPDLSADQDEKKRREKITKIINNAYAAKDITVLKSIQEKELVREEEIKATELEKTIVLLENALIRITNEYQILKNSEWYVWRKKTKEEKDVLFNELERSLMREVLRKELILEDLKREVR